MEQRPKENILKQVERDLMAASILAEEFSLDGFEEYLDKNIVEIAKMIQKERHRLEDIQNGK